MTLSIDHNRLASLSTTNRHAYLLEQLVALQEIWILVSDGGSVLLNSEGEDCVPVWPHKECADLFINGEWSDCNAQSITLNDWRSRWTDGLTQDELLIAVFPNSNEESLVLEPLEFHEEVNAALSKSKNKAKKKANFKAS
jgi:hypothetical protein